MIYQMVPFPSVTFSDP